MRSFSKWPVCRFDTDVALPDALITARVSLAASAMPPEVALLLPNAGGAQDILSGLDGHSVPGLGLFLADPNLVPARLSRQISRHTGWVCNFPSVGQHEHEFRRYLAEVDLDHAREMRVLSDIGAADLSIVATVSAVRDLDAALAVRPAALLVVPPVPEFTSGTAPLPARVALERAIADRAGPLPIIGLRETREAAEGLSAGLRPPEVFTP